ncbi:hypothetical protein NEDG_02056 [Nematocida displodere]|uniref:Uncharacterized protein n=1 Tax=Nematocida displodere TaxID=1805483 RepID=A0A177EK09_9MICR|nr:hypothetical protein NEDG_02056 [Nematocida displodere]
MDEYIADYGYAGSISCISENESVCARIDEKYAVVTAYEKIIIWDVETLSIAKCIRYTGKSAISAIGVVRASGDGAGGGAGYKDVSFVVGHANGVVVHLSLEGEEIAGHREHRKKVVGVATSQTIGISYTTNGFVVYDASTESVIIELSLELSISAVSICGDKVFVGSDKGVVHVYMLEELLKGTSECKVINVGVIGSNGCVMGVVAVQDARNSYFAILPETLIPIDIGEDVGEDMAASRGVAAGEGAKNLNTKPKPVAINHRIAKLDADGSNLVTKDTKNKYHLLKVTKEGLSQTDAFKTSRPIKDVLAMGPFGLLVFADNGLSLYRESEVYTTTDGGRENLVGLCANDQVILGITESEGRLFGRIEKESGSVEPKETSISLFDDEKMSAIASDGTYFYIGRGDGSISVRDTMGLEVRKVAVSSSPILSLDRAKEIMAVASEQKVFVCIGSEIDEIEYNDEVVCVRLSKDGSLVVAALADNTVKVHKIDGEHVLTLYGHSVPVTAIEISLELGLIYTLGGDKLIKVWGVRHGDCRKTLSPGDPTGFLLVQNTLVVSTAYGMIYYLADALTKAKKIEYVTGKKRGTSGSNRVLSVGLSLFMVRERSVSHFEEGEYGVIPEEEQRKEDEEREAEEIGKERRIYKVDNVALLEEALEEGNVPKIYNSLISLSKTDIEKTVDMMNTETREVLTAALDKILEQDYNPLLVGWTLAQLSKSSHLPGGTRAAVRQKIRSHTRTLMSNRAALIWSQQSTPDTVHGLGP